LECETGNYINWGLGVGAVKNHPILKNVLDVYESMSFIREDGSLNMKTCPVIQSEVMEKYGFERNGEFQLRDNVAVYPMEFFAPIDYDGAAGRTTEYTYSIHHFAHPLHSAGFSWEDMDVCVAIEKKVESIKKIKQQINELHPKTFIMGT